MLYRPMPSHVRSYIHSCICQTYHTLCANIVSRCPFFVSRSLSLAHPPPHTHSHIWPEYPCWNKFSSHFWKLVHESALIIKHGTFTWPTELSAFYKANRAELAGARSDRCTLMWLYFSLHLPGFVKEKKNPCNCGCENEFECLYDL